MSVGGIIAGLLDYAYDKKINNEVDSTSFSLSLIGKTLYVQQHVGSIPTVGNIVVLSAQV